jgi:hypothetical protein
MRVRTVDMHEHAGEVLLRLLEFVGQCSGTSDAVRDAIRSGRLISVAR